MPGILCRSHASTAVCRSHASTAACVPAGAHAAVAPAARRQQYHHYHHDRAKYARLIESRRFSSAAGDRYRAVTLPMVTKRERAPPAKPTTTTISAPSSLPAAPAPSGHDANTIFQVVVMRVSIHCQGCAGKVRKHISKMEGVTSFSIDLESKRVTVMGHVSPVGVLESISKVKKAEFWTPC
ncbi:protein SODIUM POTASSIUM ROOT DEFECTIVE 1-like [Iris pallida]|uniref:Protein SODIUM POTASSIUM ROOT DEFECTIVE 1-like n=1 Tax=Iris pallida TaxID=29817 RepID=A0AAX6H1S2_IRIPA|nr:protein SODIUM POTASSIUM ROOT DEFECTIVE 1-like [Iris pallida]